MKKKEKIEGKKYIINIKPENNNKALIAKDKEDAVRLFSNFLATSDKNKNYFLIDEKGTLIKSTL